MKLSCALVACNDNPHYLDFWPVVKKAWWDIVGIPCIMVYVADTIPGHLKTDPAVIHFQPIQGWPTATQAQVIRLLYPALLKGEGAVILSDMDMIPMQQDFFHKGFEPFHPNQFVSLRGIDEHEKQIYMCYVGATPQTWQDLFGIQSIQDILYAAVKHWQQTNPERIGLLPWSPTIPRLDRGNPTEWIQRSQVLEANIEQSLYVDFHMPPYKPFQLQIDGILDLASNQHS